MNLPATLKYTKEHEWIRVEGDVAYIGITDHAQKELGDIVYVDIDTLDKEVAQHEVFGTVEAVKTVSDLFSPITGTVLEINDKLDGSPETVNSDPYGDGWMVKMSISQPGGAGRAALGRNLRRAGGRLGPSPLLGYVSFRATHANPAGLRGPAAGVGGVYFGESRSRPRPICRRCPSGSCCPSTRPPTPLYLGCWPCWARFRSAGSNAGPGYGAMPLGWCSGFRWRWGR